MVSLSGATRASNGGVGHVFEQLAQGAAHFLAVHNLIDQPVFQHELGGLKSWREIGVSGFFDHSRSGEADHALGFGDDDVAESGETCGDSAGGGVGEDGDVGQSGLAMAGEGGAGFGHLHEAEDAFMHAGTAGGGKNDDGFFLGGGELDGAGDFLADDATHAGTEKAEVHDSEQDGGAFDASAAGDDSFLEAGFDLVGFDFVEIAFEA